MYSRTPSHIRVYPYRDFKRVRTDIGNAARQWPGRLPGRPAPGDTALHGLGSAAPAGPPRRASGPAPGLRTARPAPHAAARPARPPGKRPDSKSPQCIRRSPSAGTSAGGVSAGTGTRVPAPPASCPAEAPAPAPACNPDLPFQAPFSVPEDVQFPIFMSLPAGSCMITVPGQCSIIKS